MTVKELKAFCEKAEKDGHGDLTVVVDIDGDRHWYLFPEQANKIRVSDDLTYSLCEGNYFFIYE